MKSQRRTEEKDETTRNINEIGQPSSMAMPSLIERTNAITKRVIESNHDIPQIQPIPPKIPSTSSIISTEPQWMQQGELFMLQLF